MKLFKILITTAVCAGLCCFSGCSDTKKNEIDLPYKLEYFAFSAGDELTETAGKLFKDDEDIDFYSFENKDDTVNIHITDSPCFRTPDFCLERELDLHAEFDDSYERTDSELNGYQCTEVKADITSSTGRFVIYLHSEGNHIDIDTTYEKEYEQTALKFAREIADSVVYCGERYITDEEKHFENDFYEATYSPKWRLFTSENASESDLEFVYAMAEDDEHLHNGVTLTNFTKKDNCSSVEELDKKVCSNISKMDIVPESAEETFMGVNAKTYSYECDDKIRKTYLFKLNDRVFSAVCQYSKNCPDTKSDLEELLGNINIK